MRSGFIHFKLDQTNQTKLFHLVWFVWSTVAIHSEAVWTGPNQIKWFGLVWFGRLFGPP